MIWIISYAWQAENLFFLPAPNSVKKRGNTIRINGKEMLAFVAINLLGYRACLPFDMIGFREQRTLRTHSCRRGGKFPDKIASLLLVVLDAQAAACRLGHARIMHGL